MEDDLAPLRDPSPLQSTTALQQGSRLPLQATGRMLCWKSQALKDVLHPVLSPEFVRSNAEPLAQAFSWGWWL